MQEQYPVPKWIFVDVDGTLFEGNVLNECLVKWCREKKLAGFQLVLWSCRGADHAKQAALLASMIDVFDFIISKPGYIVDDNGWRWINFTQVVSKELNRIDLARVYKQEHGCSMVEAFKATSPSEKERTVANKIFHGKQLTRYFAGPSTGYRSRRSGEARLVCQFDVQFFDVMVIFFEYSSRRGKY